MGAAGSPSHPPTDPRFALPKGARASAPPVTQTALPRSPPSDLPVRSRPVAAPEDLVRYGPGIPAAPSGARVEPAAARAWRGGPPEPAHRRTWVGLVLGSALTVILLAASGVLFYVRFHHPPLQVTRVAIVHSGRAGCTVAVGPPDQHQRGFWDAHLSMAVPRRVATDAALLVSAGQHSVNVQVTVEGSGNGTALQRVWLRVLHPDRRIASKDILVRCQ